MKLTPDDPKLTAYALGELSTAERAAVEAELRHSPDCRRAVDEIRQTARQLTEELAAEACPTLTPAQSARVTSNMANDASRTVDRIDFTGFWSRWKRGLTFAGAAAVLCVLLALAVGPWKHSTGGNDTSANGTVVPQPKFTPADPRFPGVNPPATSLVVEAVAVQPQTASPATPAPAATVLPLALALPMPTLKGTPDELPTGPNIEPPPTQPPTAPLVPAGVTNVALGKPVTLSDRNPISGQADMATDGFKEAFDDQVIEMRRGTQWVQVDLGDRYRLYALVSWHDHRWIQLVRDVVVQIADDADFTANVRTLFNSDLDNSSGLGLGADKEYFQMHYGKTVAVNGQAARYVRIYSRGSNLTALNTFTELEAYGLPEASASPIATAIPGSSTETNLTPLRRTIPPPGFK